MEGLVPLGPTGGAAATLSVASVSAPPRHFPEIDTPWFKGSYLRRNFSSSRLVRLLGDSASVDIEAPKQDFAERLSLWLNAFDAIKLHAAQQSIKTVAEQKPSRAQPARNSALEEEFQRVRAALVKTVTDGLSGGRGKRAATPTPSEAPHEADAEYAPYRQRYLDQQRHMELKIGAFRDHARQALSKASPRLRQLATLDAALDEALGGREQKLLSTVPAFLERRFEQLRKTHQGGGWLDIFGKELHEVLLAELDIRLEPVAGLIEAHSNEFKNYQ